jgi:hypothetical protein
LAAARSTAPLALSAPPIASATCRLRPNIRGAPAARATFMSRSRRRLDPRCGTQAKMRGRSVSGSKRRPTAGTTR